MLIKRSGGETAVGKSLTSEKMLLICHKDFPFLRLSFINAAFSGTIP